VLVIVTAWAGAQSSGNPQAQPSTATSESDAAVLKAMRTIVHAEIVYFTAFPQVGFTCTLADLGGSGGGQPNPHQAMLISSDLASGRRDG
jgi:type IV pilus assembly protein PilA